MRSATEPAKSTQQEAVPRPSGSRRHSHRARNFVLALLLLIVVIVVPPFINVNHYRRSILQSISAGLGRQVYARSVDLSLFPRPAFVLHDFTVSEDSAFGSEPVLMAGAVTANLRASTLWHRRVEIASLHFDAPSLNLVRNSDGRWNFESLLGNSPSLRSLGQAGPRQQEFPYIDASDARINFKRGAEKLPLSLEGADLAIWKTSGNEWHVRLRAHPVRTDLTTADVGEVRGEAVLHANNSLADSPLSIHIEWSKAELGEMLRLTSGNDYGWRGITDWATNARGTLADLAITSQAQVQSFHRAEFLPLNELDLNARCIAHYSITDHATDSLDCRVPLGSGRLLVQSRYTARNGRSSGFHVDKTARRTFGSSHGQAAPSAVNHAIIHGEMQNAPAKVLLNLLRHIHPGIAKNAAVSGFFEGHADCAWQGTNTGRTCMGVIRSTPLQLQLPGWNKPLVFSPVMLTASPTEQTTPVRPQTTHLFARPALPSESSPRLGVTWILSPAHVSLGGAMPLQLSGEVDSSGSVLRIVGPADLTQLVRLATDLRIPALPGQLQSVRGKAELALTVDSKWLPQPYSPVTSGVSTNSSIQFVPSLWTGNVKIHGATLKLASLPEKVKLASALVSFAPGTVEWTHLAGTFAGTDFDGSLSWATPCENRMSSCARTFVLHSPDLNVGLLATRLRAAAAPSGLFSEIDPWASHPGKMPEISGTLRVDSLTAGRLSIKNAMLHIAIDNRSANLLGISGEMFGGTLSGGTLNVVPEQAATGEKTEDSGVGSVRWYNWPPAYSLRVALINIDPRDVASLLMEPWGSGSADVNISLHTRGWSTSDLARQAKGTFTVVWKNGAIGAERKNSTRKFQRWNAYGTFSDRTLHIQRGEILLSNGRRTSALPSTQAVTGTVTFDRKLDLRMQPSNVRIAGTLFRPVFTSPGMRQQSP